MTSNVYQLKTSTNDNNGDELEPDEQQPLLSPRNDEIRKSLRDKIHLRKASLTDCEAAFLNALLIDPPPSKPSNLKKRPELQQIPSSSSSDSNDNAADALDDNGITVSTDSLRTDAAVKIQEQRIEKAVKVLDDEMLFSIPPDGFGNVRSCRRIEEGFRRGHPSRTSMNSNRSGGRISDDIATDDDDDEIDIEKEKKRKTRRQSSKYSKRRSSILKKPEQYKFLVGLWQAFEDGFTPDKMLAFHKKKGEEKQRKEEEQALLGPAVEEADVQKQESPKKQDKKEDKSPPLPTEVTTTTVSEDLSIDDDLDSVKSDEEVRRFRLSKLDSYMSSDDSSWDEEEGGFEHFDTWQVLKDEYAIDNGFDYKPDYKRPSSIDAEDDTDDIDQHKFHILGTSAEDVAAHPHVLSPPLMDSLMNFVPEAFAYGQNWWLKYSLVRDGASLETLKRYVRASANTIIAIETTKGHVFGSFTSTPWRTQHGMYGGDPSFVWRMRHCRNSPCHSLLEQAQLESEIDVYFLLSKENLVQCSPHDMLGVGEGNVLSYDEYGRVLEERDEDTNDGDDDGKPFGFAIALEDDLLAGTSSRCSSYKNPCLVDPTKERGEAFYVLNLEVWTFTPCMTVDSAEKLEMSQFFIQESIRSTINSNNNSLRSHSNNKSGTFGSASGSEFGNQEKFFRRVGHDDDNEANRERWHYRNMMDGGNNSTGRPVMGGSSPRFG